MKIAAISDLHLEFERGPVADVEWTAFVNRRAQTPHHPRVGPMIDNAIGVDLVILAGGVDVGARGIAQAGWHTTDKLDVPANITILPLPPKCPELNPTENVWQFMRDNWLSNRVFKSYDDVVDHCCHAWNKLINQPWRIMSIGLRDWVHGF
jgi:hypothetical protein